MKKEEKAKFIAEQCKPCSRDFYSGIYQGVLLALRAEESEFEFGVVTDTYAKVDEFEVGRAYQHKSGSQMFIIGKSTSIKPRFIIEKGWAEGYQKEPISDEPMSSITLPIEIVADDQSATDGWFEIPKTKFFDDNIFINTRPEL